MSAGHEERLVTGRALPGFRVRRVVLVDGEVAARGRCHVRRSPGVVGVGMGQQQARDVGGARADGRERRHDLRAGLLDAHVDEGHLAVVVAQDEPVDEVAEQGDAPHTGSELDRRLLGHEPTLDRERHEPTLVGERRGRG